MDLVRIIQKGRWACQQGQFHTILWIMYGLLYNPVFDTVVAIVFWIQIFLNKKDSCLFPIKATSQVRRCASEISVMCFVNAFREMWDLKKGSHIGFVAM